MRKKFVGKKRCQCQFNLLCSFPCYNQQHRNIPYTKNYCTINWLEGSPTDDWHDCNNKSRNVTIFWKNFEKHKYLESPGPYSAFLEKRENGKNRSSSLSKVTGCSGHGLRTLLSLAAHLIEDAECKLLQFFSRKMQKWAHSDRVLPSVYRRQTRGIRCGRK